MARRVRPVRVVRAANDVRHGRGPAPRGGRGSDNHARPVEGILSHSRGDDGAGSAAGDIAFSGLRAELVAQLGIPKQRAKRSEGKAGFWEVVKRA